MRFKFLIICLAIHLNAFAQAPVITYNGPQTYITGIPIAPLTPNNSGATVPSTIFGTVTTLAGDGVDGSTNGSGTAARFYDPIDVAVDKAGNIFVADYGNHLIRKITPNGSVSTFAGSVAGYKDGIGTNANFQGLSSITIDANDNLYVSETVNNRIRKITPDGVVSTLAGNGIYNLKNGTGTAASFLQPIGLACDATGNLYVTENGGSAIRKITPDGVVTTFVGDFSAGFVNGIGTAARFSGPTELAFDYSGNLFVVDQSRRLIRKVTPDGTVSTFLPANQMGYSSYFIRGLAIDRSGGMYVADNINSLIRYITPTGTVISTPVAGNGTNGADDGIGNKATFNGVMELQLDGKGNLYLVDQFNSMIRKMVSTGYMVVPDLPTGLQFDRATGIISAYPLVASPATNYTINAFTEAYYASTIVNISTVTNSSTPTIASFSPTTGFVGSIITIQGNHLINAKNVKIGGVEAIVLSNTNTEIKAMVMPLTSTGSISVATQASVGSSSQNLTIKSAPVSFAQQGSKVSSPSANGAAQQGYSVAISADGNTAIIGGYFDNNSVGAAWIYTRSNGIWTPQSGKLVGTNSIGASKQGYSVALSADGNTALVGGLNDNNGRGAVWTYTRSNGIWSQLGKKIFDGSSLTQGRSVAISADGNTMAFSGSGNIPEAGAIWIHARNGDTWKLERKFSPDNSWGALFGSSIALSATGTRIIVGGSFYNSQAGAAWMFYKKEGTWGSQVLAIGSGAIGASKQGTCVAISADGNTAMVGGPGDNNGTGAVWVFYNYYDTEWPQKGSKITPPSDAVGTSAFGSSIGFGVDGNVAIIGGIQDEYYQGALWVYKLVNGTYMPQGNKLKPGGAVGSPYLGLATALSADGNTIISGGPLDDNNKGAFWVYKSQLAPDVFSTDATDITQSTATLNGTVDDNQTSTTVSFEYGKLPDLSDAIVVNPSNTSILPPGSGATNFTAKLTNLTLGTSYFYRINASSSYGNTKGNILKFNTVGGIPTVGAPSPSSGAIGTLVTILGTNLQNAEVKIGGVTALTISNSTTHVSVIVMPGSVNGQVSITTSGGNVSAGNFKITNTMYPSGSVDDRLYVTTPVITPPSTSNTSETSISLSADGSTALFISSSSAYPNLNKVEAWVFIRVNNRWVAQSRLTGPSDFILDGRARFSAISADGNTAIVTGREMSDQLVVWAFTRTGTTWSQPVRIKSPANNIVFMSDRNNVVSLSGDGKTLAILSSQGNANTLGGVWVYKKTDDGWSEQPRVLIGNEFTATRGIAMTIDGNVIIIAGEGNGTAFPVWTFQKTNGVWQQLGPKLSIATKSAYGLSVNADGTTMAIDEGSETFDNRKVGFFVRNGDTWTKQATIDAPSSVRYDAHFGYSSALSADGNVAIIGAPGDNFLDGAVLSYQRTGSTWKFMSKLVKYHYDPTVQGGSLSMAANGSIALSTLSSSDDSRGAAWTYSALPAVVTLPLSSLTSTSATLNGSAYANGTSTTVKLEYGTSTTALTSATLTSGTSPLDENSGTTNFSSSLQGLTPNTTYYYRISATNNQGTITGEMLNFKTSNSPLIYSFSPTTAKAGTEITITGLNFTGITNVTFGQTAAKSFVVKSPTTITAILDNGNAGQVMVFSPAGNVNATSTLSFVPKPVISAVGPVSVPKGNVVELKCTAPSGSYTYKWSKDGVDLLGSTNTYTASQPGVYRVILSLDQVTETSEPLEVFIGTEFGLPSNNYNITTTGVSCRGQSNGSINITAVQNTLGYTVNLTGPVTKSISMSSSVKFDALPAGTYTVCFKVSGEPTYQQCYTVVVTEPKNLAVYSAVNQQDNTVNLTLEGGQTYTIDLNGKITTTTQSSITLPLSSGMNVLSVSTEKPCQGVIKKEISLSGGTIVYPNPFVNSLNVNLGDDPGGGVTVEVFSSIKNVYNKKYIGQSGYVQIDLPNLSPGLYIVKISSRKSVNTYKVIKQ